ncbi:baculoviral IAP repeat-containing protein 3 [Elysia marginata]|uniref:Baculoviral IAP repeat-containing protein 3 n=1 Tax=Elysia marginata TaxID=1093978 RepID=A0AAV4J9C4_9GAST|nr:baculoviral IAP repeat-containing protein 3 [Elysia marginata]
MASYESRLATFSHWPLDNIISREEVAQAGFFYTGDSDCTRCYCCGGGVRNWKREDNAWLEHARWFPCCALVQSTLSEELVDVVREMRKNNQKITTDSVNHELTRTQAKQNKDDQMDEMDTSRD